MVERMTSVWRLKDEMNRKSRKKIAFSRIEIKDLLKAWVAISIAFSIAYGFSSLSGFTVMLLISAFTVGIGFLSHELAHKFVAQHYGYWSEFRADNKMLIFAILMSFFGFIFAAPGAVITIGHADRTKDGKISLAGPLTNLTVALIFLGISKMTMNPISVIASYGFSINTWLALFNMIPFSVFDGSKIFRWNRVVWAVLVGIAAAMLFVL